MGSSLLFNPDILFNSLLNGEPIDIVIKQLIINPNKYTNPLKSWLNNDANEKNKPI